MGTDHLHNPLDAEFLGIASGTTTAGRFLRAIRVQHENIARRQARRRRRNRCRAPQETERPPGAPQLGFHHAIRTDHECSGMTRARMHHFAGRGVEPGQQQGDVIATLDVLRNHAIGTAKNLTRIDPIPRHDPQQRTRLHHQQARPQPVTAHVRHHKANVAIQHREVIVVITAGRVRRNGSPRDIETGNRRRRLRKQPLLDLPGRPHLFDTRPKIRLVPELLRDVARE